MGSLSYRSCWHRVRNPLFPRYRQCSSLGKAIYTPKGFIWHAASLHQACAHCGIFSTAASRRSLDRVSVPVSRAMLSHPVPVVALVSFYLTNKLIGHRLLQRRRSVYSAIGGDHRVLARLSPGCSRPLGRLPMCSSPVCHLCIATLVRLACLRHAASVRPEPGSNSQ